MDASMPPPRLEKFNYFGDFVVSSSEGKLLDHQKKALLALQEWFKTKPKEIALAAMPTGSGKTGVICCLPYFLGALKNDGLCCFTFDKPILVIAPNLEIASQLEGQILISSDDPDANFICSRRGIISKERVDVLPEGVKIEETKELRNPLYLRTKEIIIANAQKFLSGKWESDLPNDLFRMVIVDEAHHFPAKTWYRIITKFRSHALIAFFTATPFRTDRQSVVPGPFAYHLPLQKARKLRIIRRTDWFESKGDASVSSRRDLSEIYSRVLKIVRRTQKEKNRVLPLPNNIPHMAIAITKDTRQANQVQQLWNTKCKDDSAVVYHSQLTVGELGRIMTRIKNNDVKLVVVVEMLKEGFDHPPISLAVILTKIVSPVKFTQFVGRAQRIVRTPDGKSESKFIHAHVVTHCYFKQENNYKKFLNEELIV